MNIMVFATSCDAVEGDEHVPAHDPLREGYHDLGNALAPTGEAQWCDESFGTSYGDGHRFEHEETLTMTKVASKKFNRSSPDGNS